MGVFKRDYHNPRIGSISQEALFARVTLTEADVAVMFKLILSLFLIYIFQLSLAGKTFFFKICALL